MCRQLLLPFHICNRTPWRSVGFAGPNAIASVTQISLQQRVHAQQHSFLTASETVAVSITNLQLTPISTVSVCYLALMAVGVCYPASNRIRFVCIFRWRMDILLTSGVAFVAVVVAFFFVRVRAVRMM